MRQPIYYRCNNGGWNKSHGTVEKTPRIDSFESAKQEYDGILLAGHTMLDFERYVEYGPGDIEKELVYLCGGRWKLRLVRIHNGFGGTRAFWLCPCCCRRVRYLYFNGNSFVCRECAKLNYSSQQQTKDCMMYYRKGMDLAENKLSVNPSLRPDGFYFCEFVPPRPPYMHKSTYLRHLSRFLKYRELHTYMTMADLMRLVGPAAWRNFIGLKGMTK